MKRMLKKRLEWAKENIDDIDLNTLIFTDNNSTARESSVHYVIQEREEA